MEAYDLIIIGGGAIILLIISLYFASRKVKGICDVCNIKEIRR